MRFATMDSNNDGVISRREWRGSEVSFRDYDWNGDGLLSGDEVRPGARRPGPAQPPGEFNGPDSEDAFDNWTVEGFIALDRNKDGRITRDEWQFARDAFRRADFDNDSQLTRIEFLGAETSKNDQRERSFRDLDENNDGQISRLEWHGTRAWFDARDANRDGRLTPQEFDGTAAATAERGPAYRAGAERGLIEGRAAGREDRERSQGWDLEGQRELESADSGYESRFGLRAEYQAGYRDGFRKGYREGYGPK
jgi:Ca2+-binding EF-hand superfamily protein